MKPPYSIPPLSEIRARRHDSGLSAASTFSGCGGACLGLNWAGIDVLWASEFIPAARESYKLNHPDAVLDPRDIRDVTAQEILSACGLEVGDLDLLEGSPPCAAFSSNGKREKGWGQVRKYSDTKQRVDDLFYEYARLLEGLQPKTFIAENVAGLARGVAKGYLKEIAKACADAGYRVGVWNLDCKWLGVPQSRKRIVIHGVRNDLEGDLVCPKPLTYLYTWSDAMQRDLPPPLASDPGHSEPPVGSKVRVVADQIPPGRSGQAVLGPGMYFDHHRCHPSKPAPCIIQGTTFIYPPTGSRYLSIQELRRICGFPDDFDLSGTFDQQWERLGRSVMPPMYLHVGQAIVEFLRSCNE